MKLTKYQVKELYLGILGVGTILLVCFQHEYKGRELSVYMFITSLIAFIIITIPFVLLYLYAFNNKKRIIPQAIVKGLSIWTYIAFFSMFLTVIIHIPNPIYINVLLQFIIGIYLIYRYKFPKGYIWLIFFFNFLAILYLLIYGFVKFAKKSSKNNGHF